MISNPCNWFVNGSEQKEFTYEGGSKLFHFSPNDNNLSTSMDTNVIFFANDEAHAMDVLRRMFEFRLWCAAKYIAAKSGAKDPYAEQFIDRAKKDQERTTVYLAAVIENKVKLTEVPTNQFFKIGWASNDNILS